MGWSPRGVRRLLDIDRRLLDATLAGAVLLATIEVGRQYRAPGFRLFDSVAAVLCALTIGPTAVRRRAPVAAFMVSALSFTAYLALGYQPTIAFWGPVLGLYTVAALRPLPHSAVAAALAAMVFGYSALADRVYRFDLVVMQAVLVTGIAWAFGVNTRRLAERNERLAALGEQLRREQRQREHRAVAEERIRIARELHDVVAHQMAVIAMQAGVARYVFDSDRGGAQAALDTVAGAARETLVEMRRMLSVLRVTGEDDDAGQGGTAGLDRLEELLDRVRAAGVPVDLTVTGQPRPLPPGPDQCVYRVVQEALTNVLKHSGPASATVTLHFDGDRVGVRVRDTGRTPPGPALSDRPGHGLIGMRERARIYGGTLAAGPRSGGGFEVVLTLPLDEPGGPQHIDHEEKASA